MARGTPLYKILGCCHRKLLMLAREVLSLSFKSTSFFSFVILVVGYLVFLAAAKNEIRYWSKNRKENLVETLIASSLKSKRMPRATYLQIASLGGDEYRVHFSVTRKIRVNMCMLHSLTQRSNSEYIFQLNKFHAGQSDQAVVCENIHLLRLQSGNYLLTAISPGEITQMSIDISEEKALKVVEEMVEFVYRTSA
jgi:hypothetical protein